MWRIIVLTIGCCLFGLTLNAQSKALKKGDQLFKNKEYAEAIGYYQKALNEGSRKDRILFRIGKCYFFNNQYDLAAEHLKPVVENPKGKSEAKLLYAEVLMGLNNREEAKKLLEQYLTEEPNDPSAKQLLASIAASADIASFFPDAVIIPYSFNSSADDNGAVWYKDKLVFSSDRNRGPALLKQKSGLTGREYLQIYGSTVVADTLFQTPKSYSNKLNGLNRHSGNPSFSKDGAHVYFTQNNNVTSKRNVYTLQLYSASNGSGAHDWKDVEKLSFCSDEYNYMHPAISPSGDTLVFVSDRPGGEGVSDLWYTYRDKGEWKRPINLGPELNSQFAEGFPSIDSTGRLFYCSKGLAGFGGFDIFVALPAQGGGWLAPVNIGAPINSGYDDLALAFDPTLRKAVFTTARSGTDDDLFLVFPDGKFQAANIAELENADLPEDKIKAEKTAKPDKKGTENKPAPNLANPKYF